VNEYLKSVDATAADHAAADDGDGNGELTMCTVFCRRWWTV